MRKICHKITEPSAQIPTKAILVVSVILIAAGHKITEPSAQIPTDGSEKQMRSDDAYYHTLRHKITEPSAQIPTKFLSITLKSLRVTK